MIISQEGKVMGMGTAPEIAVDVLGIMESINEHENRKDIVNEMIQCESECDTNTLKKFAELLISALEAYQHS